MKTTTHRRWDEIVAEKRSPFKPHRGLAASNIFLDTMLDRRIGETRLIDCTESLGNIYRNGSQTCRPKGKTYRDAQLGELVYSIVIEHVPEYEVICGSEPTWKKRGEGETAVERWPPRASGCEAAMSLRGWQHGIAETLNVKSKSSLLEHVKCRNSFTTLSPAPLLKQPALWYEYSINPIKPWVKISQFIALRRLTSSSVNPQRKMSPLSQICTSSTGLTVLTRSILVGS
jgi:hypothetical protein